MSTKKTKRIISLVLAAAFLFLTACSEKSSKTYGDAVTDNTLLICVDCRNFSGQVSSNSSDKEYEVGIFLEALAHDIKRACGIEKLAFEVVPPDGAKRKSAMQRLRTEVMAGSGPDVFIMSGGIGSYEFGYNDALFNFPENNMEGGLFLPLDEYMANNTQLNIEPNSNTG